VPAMGELAPGIYQHLLTHGLENRLSGADSDLIQVENLESATAPDVLARHLAALARRALRSVSTDDVGVQIELANRIADAIATTAADAVDRDDLVASARELMAVSRGRTPDGKPSFPLRPEIPLSASALLVNGRGQPEIGHEIKRELASTGKVDLLCAFVKWNGVRILVPAIEEFRRRGGELRVITTTYIGATDPSALNKLAELGARIKVSYDVRMTRLHAKAWLFHRENGLSTAYVGSSNLSKTALSHGLEWNVRLAEAEQPHLISMFGATFEDYWNDPAYEDYDPDNHDQVDRLNHALAEARGERTNLTAIDLAPIEVRPYGYQSEILDGLDAERKVHGYWHNLVVMATGTGKTVVAGLDYHRLRDVGKVDSLLFVAHQNELLNQSLLTFRQVLRDHAFGELYVGGQRPEEWKHVFASVQSLHRLDLANLDPRRFDMVDRRRVSPCGSADVSPVARPSSASGARGPHRDARTLRRPRHPQLVRRQDCGRAAAVGGAGTQPVESVPVLRHPRRNRSVRHRIQARARLRGR
jgi:HKD family nuclease